MEQVWGYDYYGDLRAVDVAIRRLREKIEDEPASPRYIITKKRHGDITLLTGSKLCSVHYTENWC
mgnify:CR=1 FL=1